MNLIITQNLHFIKTSMISMSKQCVCLCGQYEFYQKKTFRPKLTLITIKMAKYPQPAKNAQMGMKDTMDIIFLLRWTI